MIRAALAGRPVTLTGRERRSLRIAYDRVQNNRANRGEHSRQYRFSQADANWLLDEAAEAQQRGVWHNTLTP